MALISCDDQLGSSIFDPLLSSSRALEIEPGWVLSQPAAAVPSPIPVDAFLGPVLALKKSGQPPGYKLLACGETRLQLPADADVAEALQYPGSDVIVVRSKPDHNAFSTTILRPRAGTATTLKSQGPPGGAPVYWNKQQLLVWQEAKELVVYDLRTKKALRQPLEKQIELLPGVPGTSRLLMVLRKSNGADLYELRVDKGRTTAQIVSLDLAVGTDPLFSLCAGDDDLHYLVTKRLNGSGFDLVAVVL